MMGTFLRIEAFHSDEARSKEVVELAFNEVKRIEQLLSRFKEESQIYQLNRFASIEPQLIDGELFHLIEECLEFSKRSSGAFDISVAPLMELWTSAQQRQLLPSDREIQSLLPKIGYRNVILNQETRTIQFASPLVKIDLGAIGKGYAIDRAVEVLKQEGIKKACLDFGGHLHSINLEEIEGEDIGIRNPMDPEEVIYSLTLNNQSISTSANYERNFDIQGEIHGHLMDPRTGYPVENRVLSASVIAPSAMVADGLSTAIFVLGLEQGMRLIQSREDAEAIIITHQNGKPKLSVSQKQKEALV